jgi:hypothetical protein
MVRRSPAIPLKESKRRKLRKGIWLIHFLLKNEYRIFKCLENTVRREII